MACQLLANLICREKRIPGNTFTEIILAIEQRGL
jgi:hypothetical protein